MTKEQTYSRVLALIAISWTIYVSYVYFFRTDKKNPSTNNGDKSISHNILKSIKPTMGELGVVHSTRMTNQEIRQRLGRSTWTLLHTMAAVYPAFPTVQHKKDTLQFIYLLSSLFPCGECAGHFQKLLSKYPPKVTSHDEFVQWLCTAHNVVNKRLGKEIVDCKKVEDMWSCGCSAD